MTDEPDQAVNVTAPKTWATGIPAITSTLKRTIDDTGVARTARTFLKVNQPDGFDCPGCAWPEAAPLNRPRAEFCENGAKAIAEEATTERADRAFFAAHDIDDLRTRSDYWLGRAGRLTEPMLKPAGATHFEPVAWDTALDLVADTLTGLDSPDEAVFYTSGRASNEAAYSYQLLARSFGTNNLPDCSNMCHEATSVALADTIGIGKGTVRLDDLHHADLVIVAGQNPGTNHPRMLSALEETKRNGGHIVAINPLPEAGLLRFKNPQRPRGIIGSGTEIADLHLPIRIGGDHALFQLWNHWRITDAESQSDLVDENFISRHTAGYDELREHLLAVDPDELLAATGLAEADVREGYQMLLEADRVIICWAMGITQHVGACDTIGEIVNTALLGGHIGRPGAGVCPVRGHSNVQGDRTMGIWEHAVPEYMDALEREFGVEMPREDGVDVVDAIRSFRDGTAKVFMGLGGNFVRAAPDTEVTEEALGGATLTVNVSTKLNRSHVVADGASLILPTIGRTERDLHDGDTRFVTVEDSMGLVHSSTGVLNPPSDSCRSEVEIICDLAERVLGADHPVDWAEMGADYDVVRSHIANTVNGFADYNRRVKVSGGFELPNPPRDSRTFRTASGFANFTVSTPPSDGDRDVLVLQTLRSHDQYNTTIYGHDDRYRGIEGDRHVIMLSAADIAAQGLTAGDRVDIVSVDGDGVERRARHFHVVEYPTPAGCAAAYYPETNVLIPLDHHGERAQTPASKSVRVRLEPTTGPVQ